MNFNWQCPFCGHHTVITDESHDFFSHEFYMGNKYGEQTIMSRVVVCPNKECREYTLTLSIANTWEVVGNARTRNFQPHIGWNLVPESRIKVFPSYIPEPILSDYREACLICGKSPKASATLSRRCLQGMIRNFWGIAKPRLADEIEAIQDKVDPDTWEAIDSLRKLGNIGAHMEKDINLIVDVDPDEAGLLIDLLETLFADWYIARHDRAERMNRIKETAAAKDALKNGGPATP